jgi:hypothetical protein
MTTTDYVVDILLVVVIFWQVRPRELTARSAVLPLVILAYAGQHYLRGFSMGGNDLLLIVLFTVLGVGLGTWSGLATRVWSDRGRVLVQVGTVAAATWVLGMGFRFAFAVYASTMHGEHALGSFSAEHGITSGQAWTTALVMMAFGEVVSRVAIMQWRRARMGDPAGLSPEIA